MATKKRTRSAKELRRAAAAADRKAVRLRRAAQKRAVMETKKHKCSPTSNKGAQKRITAAKRAIKKAQTRLHKAQTAKRTRCHSRRVKASVS